MYGKNMRNCFLFFFFWWIWFTNCFKDYCFFRRFISKSLSQHLLSLLFLLLLWSNQRTTCRFLCVDLLWFCVCFPLVFKPQIKICISIKSSNNNNNSNHSNNNKSKKTPIRRRRGGKSWNKICNNMKTQARL